MTDALRFEVAAPCPMKWSAMKGDDRKRFCNACQQHVFNLSGLRRDEVDALVQHTGGQVCVRFFRRADGTVLTRDCSRRFSQVFWERFGGVADAGTVITLLAVIGSFMVAVFFAAFVSLFGDEVRGLFGQSTTGSLSAPGPVPRRPLPRLKPFVPPAVRAVPPP
jgi:hypothetical protein